MIGSFFICIAAIASCAKGKKQNQALKIDSTQITVYKDYSVEDLNNELNDPENYTYFFNEGTKFTEDQGPYYKFWIQVIPNLDFNDYSSGESSYLVKDLGEYADHWIYFSNPFGNHSRNCMLSFFQGNLSNEEVEKALKSLDLVYIYKDKDKKNCDCSFSVNDNAAIEYIDYKTLN